MAYLFLVMSQDAMSGTLPKALIGLLPVSALVAGSAMLFFKGKSLYSLLQLFGAVCLW